MIVHNISDFTKFFKNLDACDDDLTLITSDGKTYDWKSNRSFLLSFLQTLDAGECSKMEIKFKDVHDTSRILCYLMERERQS